MKTFFRRQISLKDAGLFAYLTATCLKSGLSVVESIRVAGGNQTGRMKNSVQKVIASIEKGDNLFEAFNKQSSLWPKFFIMAIRCGEISGKLEEIFISLSQYSQRMLPVKENIRKIWFYPLVIIFFGLVVQLGLFVFFLGFKSLLFITALSSLIKLIVLVLAIGYFSQKEAVKMLFDKIQLQIPFLREFQIDLSINQFFDYLLLLYTSNINVITSVEYAADTIENLVIRKNLLNSIFFLKQGETIYNSLSQSPYISPYFLEKIYTCEQTGRLDEAYQYIVKKTNETSEQKMEIVYRTLFRIQAFLTSMSIVGTIYIISMILSSSRM